MITCPECGKMNGKGQIGTSWICDDCKVVRTQQPDRDDPEKARSELDEDAAN